MKKTSLIIAALIALTGAAQAETTTEVQTQIVAQHKPNQNTALTFNTFNTADTAFQTGRTLTAITISCSLEWWGGYFAVDNDSDSASSGTLSLTGGASLSSLDVRGMPTAATTVSHSMSAIFNLTANNGDAGNEFNTDAAGLDYARIDGPTYANREIVSGSGDVAANRRSDYVSSGVGTFVITYASSQSQNWSGLGGPSTSSTAMDALGAVTITYTYDYNAVPEPTSAALLAMGCAVICMRRRGRRAPKA
jgi:hypothetical protein